MLSKLTRGNQITIPKEIVKKAGLKEGKDYLSIEYDNGIIILKPIDIEERIPPQTYEKLLASAFHVEPGDLSVSEKDAASVLAKRFKKH